MRNILFIFIGFTSLLLISLNSLAFSTDRQPYRTAIASFPLNFDPSESVETSSGSVALQIYETLFIRNLKGNIEPGLIQDFQISQERDCYVFKLKENIKFHDGSAITSSDVNFSLVRRIKKHVGPLEIIKGVKDYKAGKTKTIKGIKIIDSKTFEITLNNPFANFPEILSDLTLSIVPLSFDENIKKKIVIGSGPYKMINITKNQIDLNIFDGYYGKKPDVKKISFIVTPTEVDAKKLLDDGFLDNTHPFEIDFSQKSGWTKYSVLNASTQFFMLNPESKKLKDVEVRKALLSLIPFDKFHNELAPNTKHMVSHFIPLGLPGYIPEKWSAPFSEAYATKKLKNVSWAAPIVINNYLPDIKYIKIAENICNIWKKSNVPCAAKNISLDQAIKLIRAGQHEVIIGKFIPDTPETSQVLSFFRTDQQIPLFNLRDIKIDEMLDRALQSPSGHMRVDYYRVINRLIYEHFVVVPLQYGGRSDFYIRSIFKMPELDITGPYLLRMKNISYSN